MGSLRQLTLLPCALLAFVGCDDGGAAPTLDDQLRVNHIQMKGTHNSYHTYDAPPPLAELLYRHDPLRTQLSEQGVRQFELDVHVYDGRARADAVEVSHVPLFDPGTTCALLVDCLGELEAWSREHPEHHPLVVLIEPKDDIPRRAGGLANPEGELLWDEHLGLIDEAILAAWPRDRVVTPDDVRGDHPSVASALAADGWPTLADTRGKAIFALLDDGELGRIYAHDGASLRGRVMFADSAPDASYAGVILFDDPTDAGIADALARNLLIRTRADSGATPDPERAAIALASGAQMISTDFSVPYDVGDGYAFDLPQGAPSDCAPKTAPPECTPQAIESLAAP